MLKDYEKVKLGDVIDVFEYGLPYAAKKYDGKHKYIRITDIDEESRKYDKSDIVSPNGMLSDNYLVKENDILFARTGASVGKTYIFNPDDCNTYFAGFLIRGNVKAEYDANYIFYNTLTKHYKKWVIANSMRSGQPGLNSKQYSSFEFMIPKDIHEQQKVSKILLNIDNLIESTKKILQKKEKILSGFRKNYLYKEEWDKYTVGELFNIGRGRVISHSEINENSQNFYPVYSSQTSNNGIMGYLGTYDFDGEYITWTTDGANAGEVFYRNGKFNCTNVCGTLKLKNEKDFDYKFISQLLNYECKKYVSTNLANPKLMNNTMAKVELKLPTNKEEQIKISSILDRMENEIYILNKKLEKYKKIKNGLIEQLLCDGEELVNG